MPVFDSGVSRVQKGYSAHLILSAFLLDLQMNNKSLKGSSKWKVAKISVSFFQTKVALFSNYVSTK